MRWIIPNSKHADTRLHFGDNYVCMRFTKRQIHSQVYSMRADPAEAPSYEDYNNWRIGDRLHSSMYALCIKGDASAWYGPPRLRRCCGLNPLISLF